MKQRTCKLKVASIYRVFKRIFLIVMIIGVSACASQHSAERVTTPLMPDVTPKGNKYENTMSLCVQRYQVALTECLSFLSYEDDLSIKDTQMKQCLKNKGFPFGVKTCN